MKTIISIIENENEILEKKISNELDIRKFNYHKEIEFSETELIKRRLKISDNDIEIEKMQNISFAYIYNLKTGYIEKIILLLLLMIFWLFLCNWLSIFISLILTLLSFGFTIYALYENGDTIIGLRHEKKPFCTKAEFILVPDKISKLRITNQNLKSDVLKLEEQLIIAKNNPPKIEDIVSLYNSKVFFDSIIIYDSLTDIDGNVYRCVTIGNQTWMAENLKTAHYRDGGAIANVTKDNAWARLTSGAWCNYENDDAMGNEYGKLYNFYAVANAGNIAPLGWHVATSDEWSMLENYLTINSGISPNTVKALAAEIGWKTYSNPSTGTIGCKLALNNSSGFSALPCGYRDNDGSFDSDGYLGCWWTATESESDSKEAYSRNLNDSDINLEIDLKSYGFSVRCVRDY